MKKIVVGFVSIWLFFVAKGQAAPDPRDSIILESKCILPNLNGTPAFTMKVYITNKDSLTFLTLSLRESTISGTAYALLSSPRTFLGTIIPLTAGLRYFAAVNSSGYNDNSPDRFLWAAGFDPADRAGTLEPPNSARKAVWEIKFKHSSDSSGLVEFDSTRINGLSVYFTNQVPVDIKVNFVKSYVGISNGPYVQLVDPPNNGGVCQLKPTLIWRSIKLCSDTLSANYRVVMADNAAFSPADTSSVLEETTYTVPSPLIMGATYYWKVLAFFADGNILQSLETRNFTVFPNSPPGQFQLTSPQNGNKIVRKAIAFGWRDAPDSDFCGGTDTVSYTLYISPDSSFTPGYSQSGISGSFFTIPGGVLTRGMRYFWRVRASDSRDSSTFSNDIRYFDYLKLGDANTDLELTPSDIVLLINWVFIGLYPIIPREVVDMNCDGGVNTSDIVLALNAVFLNQPPPCDP